MIKNIWKKGLVIGTIILFVGTSILPTIGGTDGDFNNEKMRDLVIPTYRKTIYVDDDYTDNASNHLWDTITEGLDDADDGDLIRVYAGNYTETLEVDKSVEIIGNGSEYSKINGSYTETVVNITKSGVTISGFELKNSGEIGDEIKGIEVWHSNNIIVSENLFSNNVVDLVFSYCEGYQNIVDAFNNTFTKGRDMNNALYVYKSNNIIIRNNKFFDKQRAMHLYDADALTVSDNVFKNCYTAIRLLDSELSNITRNEISVSSKNGNFGIWVENSNDNTILYNYINSTVNRKFASGLQIQKSNRNTIKFNDFYFNIFAISCQNSHFNIITCNNFISSTSGWDLQCALSLNCYWFNYWNQLKGPFGRVLGLCIIFCIPWSPWPWQKVFLP